MATVNKILQCVFNADLRCSHAGLEASAKNLKIKVENLQPGEVIVFVNSRRTMMKLYCAFNALVHFKNRNNSKIDLRTLTVLPKFFNGKKFEYDEALKEVLAQRGLK